MINERKRSDACMESKLRNASGCEAGASRIGAVQAS
jgi:hypothetical protein